MNISYKHNVLIASHSIPKAFKTNSIESSNARAKLYLGHKAPQDLSQDNEHVVVKDQKIFYCPDVVNLW